MQDNRWFETVKVQGSQLVDTINELLKEGSIRRIVVRHEDRVVAEFPLTFGVVGAVLAPVLAAVSVLAALLTECTIEIERVQTKPPAEESVNATTEPVPDAPGDYPVA